MLLGFPFICLLISFDITEAVASVFKRKYKINYIKFAILEELNNLILTKFPYHKDFSTAPTRKIHFKNGKTFNPKGVLVNPKDTTRLGSYFVKQKYHLYIHNDVIGGETLGISATSHPKPWMRTIPMYSKPQSGKSFMVINQQYDTKLINEDISFVKQIAYNTGTQNNEVREFLLNNAAQARFFEEMETHKLKFDHTVEKEFGRYYKIASENKTLDPEIRKVAEMVENKYHNLTKKDLIDLMETHNFLTEQYDKMLGAPFDYNDFMQLKKNTYSSKNFEDFFKIINNALQEILNN